MRALALPNVHTPLTQSLVAIVHPNTVPPFSKADTPCQTLTELLKEKMGEKIKSKLAGGDTQETQLLMIPLSPPEESDDEELMANLMSSSSK